MKHFHYCSEHVSAGFYRKQMDSKVRIEFMFKTENRS